MASAKELRKRIASTKNTKQTTKAMKMVSAAKLRRAQDAIAAQRPYAKSVALLISRLAAYINATASSDQVHPLMQKDRTPQLDDSGRPNRKALVVVVTSDRGLCGPFNASVIKSAAKWVQANQGNYASIELGFVGRKGNEFFKSRFDKLGPYFSEITGKVTFMQAKKLGETLTQSYLDGKYDEIHVIYNEFVNAITQIVKNEQFLPLPDAANESGAAAGSEAAQSEAAELANFIIKPNPEALLAALLSKHFTIQAFRILLESQAGEHGARMNAMENATNNADDMIKALTLEYNKQRQAGITKELLEIIAGSESQKTA